ncbi:unnamed protein product [Boreogadus saida]
MYTLVTSEEPQESLNTSMEVPMPPPPPPPPPPAPKDPQPTQKKLYQAIAEGRRPVEGDHAEARLLLAQRESSFRKDLQWILFNKYVPSLIQDGPQCGLVALWMAAHLRQPARPVAMETIVETALKRGYTAQGEMFSARDMALLAREVCGCRADLLTGGMGGANAAAIVAHLRAGRPVLIPYDEDFNHEPCQRGGHRAHWAVASGCGSVRFGSLARANKEVETFVCILGEAEDVVYDVYAAAVAIDIRPTTKACAETTPGRTPPCPGSTWRPPTPPRGGPPTPPPREVHILAKQGKSLRYQLWRLETAAESNGQLREMDPKRSGDGAARYVVPGGGVGAGLAGQVVLLHPGTLAP